MTKLIELLSIEDLDEALEASTQGPVFLFKQSTTCPISAAAFSEFNTFVDSLEEDIGTYFVKVRETREVSNQIAEETGVEHQSPQVLFIKDREPLWNASHRDITVDSLNETIKTFG